MMKLRVASALLAMTMLFAGCATRVQAPVELKPEALGDKATRVGVIMTGVPTPNTYFPGAGCLLCMATAELANSSLTKHTKTLTLEDLPTLKDQAAEVLRKKGLNVTVISDVLDLDTLTKNSADGQNAATKNFGPLGQKYQVDKLVVLSLNQVGFTRPYSSYVPTGEPKAFLDGVGFMVDVKTNNYDWYTVASISRAANGSTWDEAPSFPGLSNAYFQVLELGKDAFLKPLAK